MISLVTKPSDGPCFSLQESPFNLKRDSNENEPISIQNRVEKRVEREEKKNLERL